MKRIKCSNPDCERVFAHVLDNGTIDIVRQMHKFTTLGKDFGIIGTCSQCPQKNLVSVKDGKLIEEGITFKEETPNGKEEENNAIAGADDNGQERQPEDNQPEPSANDPDITEAGGQPSGTDDSTGREGTGEPKDQNAEPARTHTKKVAPKV